MKLGCQCLACQRARTDRRLRRDMCIEDFLTHHRLGAFVILLGIALIAWRLGAHLYLALLS